ncbi:hypothetical protein NDU88_001851 [Pleurodeles waltl]|uniref:Uncharacterized protein n=1 Tax=Pleurodeles waltl TaxID=8319 RepID=A0AAV7T0S4_PLEWA|nr:hypothetical protein NDU88_001851 [Pleurodeles waltl]
MSDAAPLKATRAKGPPHTYAATRPAAPPDPPAPKSRHSNQLTAATAGTPPMRGAALLHCLQKKGRPGWRNEQKGPQPQQSLMMCRPSCWLASSAPLEYLYETLMLYVEHTLEGAQH